MSEFINNYSQRKEMIKEALKQIHGGKPYQQVKDVFADILKNASATEIAEIEQTLISEGLPVEDIQYLCDVHVAMFRESLDQEKPVEMTPGHPLYTFNTENELANLQLNECRQMLHKTLQQDPPVDTADLRQSIQKLSEMDKHYLRKENLLFPFLEKYGFSGPSAVMWGLHDEIRKAWKAMIVILEGQKQIDKGALKNLEKLFIPMENAMREMFYKEERILFPNALQRLNESDWMSIYAQEPEFGLSYITRGNDWPGDVDSRANADVQLTQPEEQKSERTSPMSDFPLSTGDLTFSQINLMLTHLPVDITFVDENDTVRYFSETPDRIFKRTPAIIGRKVQNCHPPASVDKVVSIVEDFKSGKRDVAEFWIQMNSKFIHIRYFAMRDAAGNYRGTLEVSQDITALRQLEGEKRLLDD